MRLYTGLGILIAAVFIGYSTASRFLIAPQILREGVYETIVLNLHGIDGTVNVVASINLEGIVQFPYNNVNARKPILMRVKYDKPRGAPESNRRQYAELIVTVRKDNKNVYTGRLKMRLIENSGYLHVQTDRPIYRPEELVKIRVIALNQQQLPERERQVEVIVRIPLENVGVEKRLLRMADKQKFIETSYQLPEFPIFGVWTIQARYTDQKVVKWSTRQFEVRPYVLPTFNVAIKLDNPYVLVKNDMSDEHITGELTAEYSYGKKVTGSYYFVAKLKRPGLKKAVAFFQFPSELERTARINNGKQRISIKATEVLKILENDEGFETLEEEGATISIEASVTGLAEGTIESDLSRPVLFVRSPYKIDISRMSRYYTPGTAFEIKADVIDSVTEQPVKEVDVILKGPTSCGNVKCPANQCCKSNKCGACENVKKATDENGQMNTKINMEANAAKLTYELMTRDFGVPDQNEARLTFTLHPYSSASKSVLQLSAVKKIATVGDDSFQIDVWFKKAPDELRYLILARGAIFTAGIHVPQKHSIQTSMNIKIEGEMVPSFKIFVYYMNGNEVVSNSLWVEVKDACKKELQVSLPKESVLPGDHVEIEYTGSPNAIIGISAVDRAAYFLYNESRLTRNHVFEGLNQYDEGCVREGGKNAQHVFEEGGLQLVGGPYEAKDDFSGHCGTGTRRKKRSANKNAAQMEAKFEQEAEKKLCEFDGRMTNLAGEKCEDRAKRVEIEESYECAAAFLDACNNQTRLSKIARSSARSAGNNAAANKALSKVRSNFEESMLWRTATLNPEGKLKIIEAADHSISTFEFDTVSMHPTDGFCVADTKHLTIFKDVFIQLKVPFSLKRREQTELRATIFNYKSSMQTVKVMVKMGKDICSHFPEEEFSEVATLEVDANSAATTNFAVLPLRIPKNEKVEIEIKAVTVDNNILDHVRKSILVQPEGEIKEIKGTKAIDLKNKRQGYEAIFNIEFGFPEHFTLGTRQCWIYPFSNFMGPIIEFDPVTKQPKNDIKNIIRMPGGCGEQTMLSMGPNTVAHKYLLAVDKMKPGSPEEAGSIDKMKKGFANELKYRCNCQPKVWSVFPRHAPSVWLNAYVNKVFAQAKQFYQDMDVGPICTSVLWLTTMQEADGSFKSGGRVIHQEMHGAVGSKLSLSAYVMISLLESHSVCPALVKQVEEAIVKVTEYLVKNENDPQMEQPYALALVSYAMSLSDPRHPFAIRILAKLLSKIRYSDDNSLAFWKGDPLKKIEGTGTHAYWYKRKPLAIDIEATGYALCSILYASSVVEEVSQETLDRTRKIVLWLIEQRDENGGFTTTQDTVVGLQALAEYMIWSNKVEPPSRDVEIDLTIGAPEGTEYAENPIRIHLNKSNENSTTPIPLPPGVIGKGLLNIKAQGEGEGSLSYRCVYRTLVEEDACHYDLAVTTEEHDKNINPRIAEQQIVLKVNILVSKPEGEPSGQSIIEVNLISGYEADEPSLQLISRTYHVDGSVERYEIANQKVILYLKEITDQPKRISFLIRRTVNVMEPEPATVTVYDYYETVVKCSQFYGLPEKVVHLRTTPCENEDEMGGEDMCQCAEGGCLKCRTRKEQLKKTQCLPGMDGGCKICKEKDETNCYNMTAMACKGNYVYEMTVVKEVTDDTGVFVEFEAELRTVYKRGPDATANPGKVRTFISRTDCYQGCTDDKYKGYDRDGKLDHKVLKKNETFLVIGYIVDQVTDKDGFSVSKYNLADGDQIERIYTQEECREAKDVVESKECKKKKKKQTKKEKEDCQKARAIHQSCYNLRLLRRMLIRGCDSA